MQSASYFPQQPQDAFCGPNTMSMDTDSTSAISTLPTDQPIQPMHPPAPSRKRSRTAYDMDVMESASMPPTPLDPTFTSVSTPNPASIPQTPSNMSLSNSSTFNSSTDPSSMSSSQHQSQGSMSGPPVYGEGMTLIDPLTGRSITASSQTGTWFEEQLEIERRAAAESAAQFARDAEEISRRNGVRPIKNLRIDRMGKRRDSSESMNGVGDGLITPGTKEAINRLGDMGLVTPPVSAANMVGFGVDGQEAGTAVAPIMEHPEREARAEAEANMINGNVNGVQNGTHLNAASTAVVEEDQPVDRASLMLGVGWQDIQLVIAANPDLTAAIKGWEKYIENHYSQAPTPLNHVSIVARNEGRNIFLVKALVGREQQRYPQADGNGVWSSVVADTPGARNGTHLNGNGQGKEAFLAFKDDLSEGRMVGISIEQAASNLMKGEGLGEPLAASVSTPMLAPIAPQVQQIVATEARDATPNADVGGMEVEMS